MNNQLSSIILASGLSTLMFVPPILAQTYNFADTQGYWAQPYVTTLAERSIISGFPDGSFQPNADITRAEFAALAVKAFNLSPSNNTRNFKDVSSNHWASSAIRTVNNSGLFIGFPDGTFRPEDRITRTQALVILAKALGGNTTADNTELNRYSDRQEVPEWAMASISKAANAGIMVNYPDSRRIAPNNLATRGEVAALMYQTLYKRGDRNLSPLAIGTIDSATNLNSPVVASLVMQTIETNTSTSQTLTEGDVLIVTAYGTPGSTASFRLEGLNRNNSISMNEGQRGVYQGKYTILRNDGQINSNLTVTFRKQGQNPITRQFNRAIAINSTANGNNNNNPVAANLVIQRIETNTGSRQTLTAGDELLVTAYGTAGSSVSFRLEGLNGNNSISMNEGQRGVYQGRYTINRNDGQMTSNLTVTFSKQGKSPITRQFNRAIAINSTANGYNNNNPVGSLVIERIETNTNPRQTLMEGDELLVIATGTPGSSASFNLEALNRSDSVTMNEVQWGVYEGRYIIHDNDGQIDSPLTVTLSREGTNSITKQFNQAIAINSTVNDKNNNPLGSLVIERIETNTNPGQTLVEGDELLVTASGTPGSSASFNLEALNRNSSITMTEVQPGIYEGRYTIHRHDGQINSPLTVTLSKQGTIPITRQFNRAIAINYTQ